MKYLFIDESGDHILEKSKMDPQFPLFVLTGVVIDSKEYQKFKRKILTFKRKLFNNEKVILHSTELNRPTKTKQKELGFLTNSEARTTFYTKLNELLKNSSFEIIAYSIDKNKFNKSFKSLPIDIYFLSFSSIFNRFEKTLKDREHGKIFAESRNKNLDKQFILTWRNTRITKRHKAFEPQILTKSWKHAGLELADLVSYRISRKLFNKSAKPIGNEIDLSIILKKKHSIEEFIPS